MLLRSQRLIPTALLVFAAALLLGLGNLLTATTPQARSLPPPRLRASALSGDDAGFSIALSSPREPYLLGKQTIVIDPTTPSGDAIAQVDIFVDGRLVFTDRQPPYTYDTDFGQAIRRHVIVATAVTRAGRRAKVSFVSRLGDLSENAAKAVELLPVIVRDPDGRPTPQLSVSDFTLLENGARQRIVHFDTVPAPASIAVLIDPGSLDETRSRALLGAAADFAAPLPAYHAIVLAGGGSETGAGLEFTYDHASFLRRLDQAIALALPGAIHPLGERLAEVAEGLRSRSGQRVLLLLIAGPPAGAEPPADQAPPAEKATPAGKASQDKKKAVPDPALAAGLEALKQAKVTIDAVVLGGFDDDPTYLDLKRASEESGGEFVIAPEPSEVAAGCRTLADGLLHQYLIGFVPEAPERHGWRAIEVRTGRADLQIHTRKGYPID
ncbi:MAG TPA: hypothetical protein VJ144_10925 [Candidatus Polarisedimenticolia bacterium]|nr:hypothetical protein [Candidatus Polarisedimenticolia bacterium]